MIDVYYNPQCCLDFGWLDYFAWTIAPFLNSTQPDLVLWYPKPDSDYQEAQKLTSFFNLLVWNKSSLLCLVVGYSVSMIYPA